MIGFARARFTLLLLAATILSPAAAQHLAGEDTIVSHGLSSFGELKYSQDLTHFDDVNPDAPKGGELSHTGWVTFRMRPEARFHDGTQLTTEDVKFSLDLLKEEGDPRGIFQSIAGAGISTLSATSSMAIRRSVSKRSSRESFC